MEFLGILEQFDIAVSKFRDHTVRTERPSFHFGRAAATQPISYFIREAEATERGVYTISHSTEEYEEQVLPPEVTKKRVTIATPLKTTKPKPDNKRRLKPRVSASTLLDASADPEVPLRAALKLVDMCLTPSNAQLRRAILERIELAQEQKERIASFTDPREDELDDDEADTHTLRALEEEVRKLEARHAEVRRKADVAFRSQAARRLADAEDEDSPVAQRTRILKSNARLSSKLNAKPFFTTEQDDTLEEPSQDSIGLDFEDETQLLETPDISQLMAQTPMRLNASGVWDRSTIPLKRSIMETPRTPPRTTVPYDEEESYIEGESKDEVGDESTEDLVVPREADDEDDLDEPTIIQRKPPVLDSPESSSLRNSVSLSSPAQPSSILSSSIGLTASLDSAKLEKFAFKIWIIAGDTLLPNNDYDIGKGRGSQKPPAIYETKSILSTVAEQSTSPTSSPEVITQVITAKLLLYLISRDSFTFDDPKDAFSSGMAEAKDLLSQVAEERGWKTDWGNKVIFTWIGKKLLKSEGGRRLRCIMD